MILKEQLTGSDLNDNYVVIYVFLHFNYYSIHENKNV